MKPKVFSFILLIILCSSLCSCTEKKVSTTEFALNTVISLTAYGDNADIAINEAVAEVRRIEELLSCHKQSSEISKINSSAHISPVEVCNETAFVLAKALEICEKTKGAFDISIKPLADLWNVTSANPVIPSDNDINSALEYVGYEYISLDGNFVSFKKEGVQIDLGGAAKGYCADKVAEIFKKYNIKNALIDLGGNIYAMGKNEEKRAWNIGLQDPRKQRGKYFAAEKISDCSIVTSGSYERFFEKDGKIYHHIINPQTGVPADSGLVGVSVVSKSSFEADMLSTAVFVMGQEEFQKLPADFNYIKYITVDNKGMSHTYIKQ